MNPDTRFESRALEGVNLQNLGHSVYEVLFTDDNGVPRILKSRHVTFDESSSPGAPYLDNYMDDESASESDFSCNTDSEIENEYSDFAIDEVDEDHVATEPQSSHSPEVQVESASESNNLSDELDVQEYYAGDNEVNHLEEHNVQTTCENESRYQRRTRRAPKKWRYMVGAATLQAVEVTTSDEPTLGEAFSATSAEYSLWEAVIQD